MFSTFICFLSLIYISSFNECVSEAISGPRQLFELYQRYENEFEGIHTALVCACEHGRMNDVLLFVNLHPFHKYIELNGVKEGNMTVKEHVNQVGRSGVGWLSIFHQFSNNGLYWVCSLCRIVSR
jgi:hypothetical protein